MVSSKKENSLDKISSKTAVAFESLAVPSNFVATVVGCFMEPPSM